MLNENGLHSPLKARNCQTQSSNSYMYMCISGKKKEKREKLNHSCTRRGVQKHSTQLLIGNLHVHPKKNG